METSTQHFLTTKSGECSAGPASLLSVLTDGELRNAVRRTVQDALNSTRSAKAIEALSSLHPNGFIRFTLASSKDFGLRLHVWDTRDGGIPYTPESIHSHTVDLASSLIAGGYTHEVYSEIESGSPYDRYVFEGVRDARELQSRSARSDVG